MNSKKFAKRKKDSGVSPVIATILMVAITVVLAAVLYVMVSGFTHSPGTAQSAGLSVSGAPGSWVVSVDKVSASTIQLQNLKIVVSISGGSSHTYTWSSTTSNWTSTGATPADIAYSSVSSSVSGTTDLSAGDSFTIVNTVVVSGSTFEIVDGNSVLASITLQ